MSENKEQDQPEAPKPPKPTKPVVPKKPAGNPFINSKNKFNSPTKPGQSGAKTNAYKGGGIKKGK